jgi:hypothetical protein
LSHVLIDIRFGIPFQWSPQPTFAPTVFTSTWPPTTISADPGGNNWPSALIKGGNDLIHLKKTWFKPKKQTFQLYVQKAVGTTNPLIYVALENKILRF